MKTNIRKIVSLMLVFLSLAALLSLMPEHNRAYTSAQADSSHTPVLARK